MLIESTFPSDLFLDKTVLVSGGTSGIGQAVARGFAAAGATVIATGSSKSKIETAREKNPNNKLSYQMQDVTDMQEVERFFVSLEKLDVLANFQGVARPDDEWEEDTFMHVMDVNLNSVMRLCRAAFPLLKNTGGSIVNVASMLSYLADESVPSYTASITGILGLTRALAHKYGPDGVRVNAVAPGYHKTNMTKPLWSDSESASKISERSALKRWGTTEDLVGPCLFLASPASGFITGATLPVDGGYVTG